MSRGRRLLRGRGRPEPADHEDVDAANRAISGSRDDGPEPAEQEQDVTEANRKLARELQDDARDDIGRDAATLNPPD